MAKSKSKWGNRYTPEFKQQMVELVRAGHAPKQLSREFGCSYWSVQSWVEQADRDSSRGNGGLTTAGRQELTRLKRENRQLNEEREILSKAAAWFAQESAPNTKRSADSQRQTTPPTGHGLCADCSGSLRAAITLGAIEQPVSAPFRTYG
jgi:transposase